MKIMALSEVDYLLIEKHGEGKLTPKEFAMWSKRMQDQEFVQAWHANEDEKMARIGAFLDERNARTEPAEKEESHDGKMDNSEKWNTIFNMAIMVLLTIILIVFIIMLISPESWVEESSFSRW